MFWLLKLLKQSIHCDGLQNPCLSIEQTFVVKNRNRKFATQNRIKAKGRTNSDEIIAIPAVFDIF